MKRHRRCLTVFIFFASLLPLSVFACGADIDPWSIGYIAEGAYFFIKSHPIQFFGFVLFIIGAIVALVFYFKARKRTRARITSA